MLDGWPFTGNTNDSSGKGNNGNTVSTTLTADRFGNFNAAYNFNGSTSRIEVPDAPSLRCRKITMSAWIKSTGSIAGQIIYKSDLSAEGEAYSLHSGPFAGVKINSNCIPATGWNTSSYDQPVSLGTWEHLVATYDGIALKIYRNGVYEKQTDITGLIDSCIDGGVRFGFSHLRYAASTGYPFTGIIDDIGIWNRALNDNEISELYNASSSTKGNVGINIVNPKRNLHVNDVLRLELRSFAPPSPSMGDIYFDSSLKKLRVFDGTTWQNCW